MSTTQPVPSPLAVAVVGSGPSGCYVAQMLRKQWPTAEITVFDRLPVPFGLLRYGVAPDHQHTKRLTHQFSRVFTDGLTRFAGNVEVGRDVAMTELMDNYHAVVLASGLAEDRALGVPGEDLHGVHGAGQVMRWVNAHPDESSFELLLGQRTVIVGNGNVAVDVLRMLIKSEDQFDGTDIADHALARLAARPATSIHIVGRSPATCAKFDTAMIRELGGLDGVRFEIEPLGTDGDEVDEPAKTDALRQLAKLSRPHARVTVSFHFGWTPQVIHGRDRVEAISFNRGGDSRSVLRIPADGVVTAIGFTAEAAAPLGELAPPPGDNTVDRTRLRSGVYSCGWFRRGATGSIPENRTCAKQVVAAMTDDLDPEALGARAGYAGLSHAVRSKAVTFAGWERISAAETAAADERRVRRKIANLPDLVATAVGDPEQPLHHEAAGDPEALSMQYEIERTTR